MENWVKALRFVRRECGKARKLGWGGLHPSFSVSEILAKAEAKYGLPSYAKTMLAATFEVPDNFDFGDTAVEVGKDD